MAPYKKLSTRRVEKGISLRELAEKVSISIDSLYDIENIPHEAYDQASIKTIKQLCQFLDIDFYELYEIKCEFCKNAKLFCDDLPRGKLIEKYRNLAGLTQEDLADQLGFYIEGIKKLESDDNYIEGWDFETIIELSRILNIPCQRLFCVSCPKCHH
ncbi:MAG: hypothetical protein CVV64_15770 [Candidatus Wallbacteria bacterium HGW-Wallbacteria-1]|jgi:transcriptional regulator with XRE-family HTH domain|uniref:HTH cro/C1-type domain-containing protein n=1 Tax=Candidatus Wallbacteria bacterium HGW-Wallbacteria-1 TaxID=2013854 RepID=A0A2N1PLE5_9BACT|nr:MAG: hypothetical protein CVV64_15770 [Candidatus Wallbacteria bacterium HGW-Wallbacteria-1]